MSGSICTIYSSNINFCDFLFFSYKTTAKKVKEHKEMVKNLKRGDEVITSGGIIGKVDIEYSRTIELR